MKSLFRKKIIALSLFAVTMTVANAISTTSRVYSAYMPQINDSVYPRKRTSVRDVVLQAVEDSSKSLVQRINDIITFQQETMRLKLVEEERVNQFNQDMADRETLKLRKVKATADYLANHPAELEDYLSAFSERVRNSFKDQVTTFQNIYQQQLQYLDKRNALYKKIRDNEASRKDLNDQLSQLRDQKKSLNLEINALKTKSDSAKTSNDTALNLSAQKNALKSKSAEITTQIDTLTASLRKSTKNQQSQINKQIDSLKKQKIDIENQIQHLKDQKHSIKNNSENAESVSQQLEDATKQYNNLKNQEAQLTKNIDKYYKEELNILKGTKQYSDLIAKTSQQVNDFALTLTNLLTGLPMEQTATTTPLTDEANTPIDDGLPFSGYSN